MKEFIILCGLAFFPVSGVLVALWMTERARARRAEESLYDLASAAQPRMRTQSSEDLRATLDAMAREIERISEAQRLTAQVLAERYDRIAGRPATNTTPH